MERDRSKSSATGLAPGCRMDDSTTSVRPLRLTGLAAVDCLTWLCHSCLLLGNAITLEMPPPVSIAADGLTYELASMCLSAIETNLCGVCREGDLEQWNPRLYVQRICFEVIFELFRVLLHGTVPAVCRSSRCGGGTQARTACLNACVAHGPWHDCAID